MRAIDICWIYMILAIVLEVAGTIFMKYSEGFTKWLPSVLVFLCYGSTFPLFILALKRIPVSTAYPIWAGMGTFLICIAGMVFFEEPMDLIKIVSAFFIILGIIGLNF